MHFTTLQPLSISGRLASSHRRHQGRHTHPLSVIAGEASHTHAPCAPGFRLQASAKRNETKRNALRSVWPAVPGSPRRLRLQRAHRSSNAPPQRTTRPRIIWRIQNSPLSHFEFLAAIIRSPRRVSPCARVRTKRSISVRLKNEDGQIRQLGERESRLCHHKWLCCADAGGPRHASYISAACRGFAPW